MFAMTTFRRARHGMLALVAAAAFAACSDDDPTEPHDEPEVAAVRLTVGANSVTISGTQSPTLDVAAGNNTVTAQWLRADGSVEDHVTDDEFELRLSQVSGNNLTWTASGALGGTLAVSGLSGGQTTAARVTLFHIEEGHEDFGPITFTVRVP